MSLSIQPNGTIFGCMGHVDKNESSLQITTLHPYIWRRFGFEETASFDEVIYCNVVPPVCGANSSLEYMRELQGEVCLTVLGQRMELPVVEGSHSPAVKQKETAQEQPITESAEIVDSSRPTNTGRFILEEGDLCVRFVKNENYSEGVCLIARKCQKGGSCW